MTSIGFRAPDSESLIWQVEEGARNLNSSPPPPSPQAAPTHRIQDHSYGGWEQDPALALNHPEPRATTLLWVRMGDDREMGWD